MRTQIIDNLKARFAAYDDLIDQTDTGQLTQTLDLPKHKSLREHLWCVVGSRESYAQALQAGEWSGFKCSMTTYEQPDFLEKLSASAKAATDAIANIEEWTPEREELLVALSEHEVMHEGQIIRHVYALGDTLPATWKWA